MVHKFASHMEWMLIFRWNHTLMTSCFDGKTPISQNLGFRTTYNKPIQPTDIIDYFGEEVNNYDFATNTCPPGKLCRHYTVIVWEQTTKVIDML